MGKVIGRNSTCWCGSGKKFKRCHWPDTGPLLSENQFMNSDTIDQETKMLMKKIDPIMDKFIEGKVKIYDSQKESRTVYIQEIIERNKKWSRSQTCMYPSCTRRTIIKSHTIQKSSSIKLIAENAHVLTPKLIELPKTIFFEMTDIGVNIASTFPGFCQEHEKIFNTFEKGKQLDNDQAIELQVFRTICQAIVFKKNELNWIKQSKGAFLKKQQEKFLKHFKMDFGGEPQDFKIRNISFENNDQRIIAGNYIINSLSDGISKLEKLYEAISYSIEKQKYEDDLIHYVLVFPYQIPVAIAGISNGTMSNDETGKKEDSIIVFNCLPYPTETIIIISARHVFKDAINQYYNYFSRSGLMVLNMIESFMVNGTEHWFIKPSLWNNLHENKKDAILKDMFYSDWKFYEEYSISIFDDLRKQFINVLQEESKSHGYPEILELHIQKEKLKLEYIPPKRTESFVDLAKLALKKYRKKHN